MIHPKIARRLAKVILNESRTKGKAAAVEFCARMTDHLPAADQAVIRAHIHELKA